MEDLPFAPTNLTAILADLAFVLVLTAGPLVLRWLQASQAAAVTYYQAHTTAGERTVLDGLAKDAVAWSEQFAQSPEGAAKFKQANALVQQALKRRGIEVNVAEVEAAVQSAWADAQSAEPKVEAPKPEAGAANGGGVRRAS